MTELGVNIDHVATVREARKTNEPDPAWAATLAEIGGADGITLHLREDRRHIQDRDLQILMETVPVRVNLEVACTDDVLAIACRARPQQVTLVPERREEVTTEGGLNVVAGESRVRDAVARLKDAGIAVSLFLDPDEAQIDVAARVAADAVELHTGAYAEAARRHQVDTERNELQKLCITAKQVVQCGLRLHAGHGLTYRNVCPVAEIPAMVELNIGHSIIARALMVGLEQAVRDMKKLIG